MFESIQMCFLITCSVCLEKRNTSFLFPQMNLSKEMMQTNWFYILVVFAFCFGPFASPRRCANLGAIKIPCFMNVSVSSHMRTVTLMCSSRVILSLSCTFFQLVLCFPFLQRRWVKLHFQSWQQKSKQMLAQSLRVLLSGKACVVGAPFFMWKRPIFRLLPENSFLGLILPSCSLPLGLRLPLGLASIG